MAFEKCASLLLCQELGEKVNTESFTKYEATGWRRLTQLSIKKTQDNI